MPNRRGDIGTLWDIHLLAGRLLDSRFRGLTVPLRSCGGKHKRGHSVGHSEFLFSNYFLLSDPGVEIYRPAHSKKAGKLRRLVWPPSCCRQASSPPIRLLTGGILSVK